MKQTINCAPWRNRHFFGSVRQIKPNASTAFLVLTFLLSGLLVTGCQKEHADVQANNETSLNETSRSAAKSQGNVLGEYEGLAEKTLWELQQARASTARYKKLANALKDGYTDIGVHSPNMGHHFMKTTLVDAQFDYRNPEILVYSKDQQGNYELVAVEYAVPRDLSMPRGFYGDSDVWDGGGPFPFWLLHAWVWKENPAGVFSPMNPTVNSVP